MIKVSDIFETGIIMLPFSREDIWNPDWRACFRGGRPQHSCYLTTIPSSTEVEAPPLEQTLTEDFHRTEKLEICPGNKTFIYLFYISGLLFEVLPTKCRKVHKVFLLQFNIAPTPYNACYLFIVKLSVCPPFWVPVFHFCLVSSWNSGVCLGYRITSHSPEIRDRRGPSWSWSELTWRIFYNWQHVCFNKAFWAIIWWCLLFTNNSLDNICQSNLIIISNPPFSGNRLEVSMKVWLH